MRALPLILASTLGLAACSDMRGIIPGAAQSDAPLDATSQTSAMAMNQTGIVAQVVTERSGGLGPLPGAADMPAPAPRPAPAAPSGVVVPTLQNNAPVVTPVLVGGCDSGPLTGGAAYCVGQS